MQATQKHMTGKPSMTNGYQRTSLGSLGPGEGRTNTVRVRRNSLDAEHHRVLCAVVCQCEAMPTIGASGRKLKQQCMSGRLKTADAISDHRSPYKAEVNYDMSRDPPAPIMDAIVITKAHAYLPGWIRKYWLDDYTPGVGNIRRPDVVIVNEPSRPPTQDNIKNIVEVKFPPDTVGPKQLDAYERIAGDPDNVAVLEPGDCGCSDESRSTLQNAPSQSTAVDAISDGLGKILSVPIAPPPALPLP